MNKKIAFISFAVLAVFSFTVWAVTTNGPQSQHALHNNMVEVSSAASHCDPSNCTPEEAASCPHENMSTTSAENEEACPATPDCPPSKCQSGKKAETQTGVL